MTTPANKPEDEDPFGYLYADGQAAGATPPPGGGYGYPGPSAGGQAGPQPGVPRTSYNQVRTVGERTYGGQRGGVPPQPQPHYGATEPMAAGGYGVPPQQQPPQHQTQTIATHGGGGGSSRRGLLIAAIAVVGAVVIGIGAALAFGNLDDKKDDTSGPQTTAGTGGQTPSAPPQSNTPSPEASASEKPAAKLPKGDAGGPGMAISGGAGLQGTVPGAKSASGQYVGGFNQVGAAVTWTLDLPKAGKYRFYIRYGIPGEDANGTLTINGTPNSAPVRLNNFSKQPQGDWEKGWQTTWGQVELKEGSNTIKLSCEAGNKCNANIDQFWLTGTNG
ncbi:CBM35 domain-containing protein [Streptomyces sp. NPDC089799]|uniref:CBM35 domain-containing protein n=1 Tax=Streptomyces sp. NPDC089799 TaxID=3155066 RepID=UPI00342695AD